MHECDLPPIHQHPRFVSITTLLLELLGPQTHHALGKQGKKLHNVLNQLGQWLTEYKLLREKFRPFLYRIVEALDRDHISKSDSSERKMDKLVEATSNISVSSAKRTGLTLEEVC